MAHAQQPDFPTHVIGCRWGSKKPRKQTHEAGVGLRGFRAGAEGARPMWLLGTRPLINLGVVIVSPHVDAAEVGGSTFEAPHDGLSGQSSPTRYGDAGACKRGPDASVASLTAHASGY